MTEAGRGVATSNTVPVAEVQTDSEEGKHIGVNSQ